MPIVWVSPDAPCGGPIHVRCFCHEVHGTRAAPATARFETGDHTSPEHALALGTFALGTIGLVIVGLLLEVAGDLGISIPAAGLLVTDYE